MDRSPLVKLGKSTYDSWVVGVTVMSTSKTLLYEKAWPSVSCRPEIWNARSPLKPAADLAVGEETGPLVVKLFMSLGGGGVVSPLDSCHSASWIRLTPPALALMSSR